jgi:hypothetical protein
VETCLGLYQQLTRGGENSVVEGLKRQMAESEGAHRRHDQLFKDGSIHVSINVSIHVSIHVSINVSIHVPLNVSYVNSNVLRK